MQLSQNARWLAVQINPGARIWCWTHPIKLILQGHCGFGILFEAIGNTISSNISYSMQAIFGVYQAPKPLSLSVTEKKYLGTKLLNKLFLFLYFEIS